MSAVLKIAILLLSISLFFSCKKKVISGPYLTLGDEESVEIEYMVTMILGVIQKPVKYAIDLNKDGMDDVEFWSGYVVGAGSGVNPVASIRTMHPSCGLLAFETVDTTFIHHTYQVTNSPSGGYAAIASTTRACRRETPYFVVESSFAVDNLLALNVGDIVDISSDFRSGIFELNSFNSSKLTPIQTVGDTTYYELLNVINDCTNFPENTSQYVAVKLNTPDGAKLGWIKFQFSEGNKIKLFEWAIQP